MITIIADSGSTKTDWAIGRSDGAFDYFQTAGLNPWFTSGADFSELFSSEISPRIPGGTDFEVHFYGAGCGSLAHVEKVGSLLKEAGACHTSVGTDLLGAGRAMHGQRNGIIGILGTGAHAGLYQDGEITRQGVSTGYILGDEGSGTWLGRYIVASWMRNEMPDDVRSVFEKMFKPVHEEIIHSVYSAERPNQYLASFARLLGELPGHAWCTGLIEDGFDLYLQKYILPLRSSEIRIAISGSVSAFFSSYMDQRAALLGWKGLVYSADVIHGLVRYHLDQDR